MNTKRLTDTEFVNSFSEELTERYKYAKSIAKVAPKGCLVELRSFLHTVINKIYQETGRGFGKNNLGASIFALKISNTVNPLIIDLLNEIKRTGDKAAHPEDYRHITHEIFCELAIASLLKFCDLVVQYKASVGGDVGWEYDFVQDSSLELQALCYRALFESDLDDKYKLATILREYREEKLIKDLSESGGAMIENYPGKIFLTLMKEASEGQHYRAMFEYGLCMLYGVDELAIKPFGEPLEAMAYLRRAAAEFSRAKAAYAFEILESKRYGNLDEELISEAIVNLSDAASQEELSAITLLAKYYYGGVFVKQDKAKALELAIEASDLDYPEAQSFHAELLCLGHEYEAGLCLLHSAYKNGFSNALLQRARLLNSLKRYDEAEKSYREYISVTLSHKYNLEERLFIRLELGGVMFDEDPKDKYRLLDVVSLLVGLITDYELGLHLGGDNGLKIKKLAEKVFKNLKGKLNSEDLNKDNTVHFHYFNADFSLIKKEIVFDKLKKFGEETKFMSSDQKGGYAMQNCPMLSMVMNKKGRSTKYTTKRLGRNEICHCGSGKKFKICCAP
jgi:TPR repeat protein